MPGFRQRPLSWLFWIATACVDAVAVFHDFERPSVNGLVMGQLYIAAGWLVLGKSHRLARAGVFVAALLALGSRDFYLGNRAGEWPFVMGTLIACGVTTAAFTWLWSFLRSGVERRPAEPSTPWQISIVEILGWMIVVAVASTVVRYAHFGHVVESLLARNVLLLYAVVTSLFMTAYLPADRRASPLFSGVAGCAILAMAIGVRWYSPTSSVWIQLLALALVGVWMLVQRLDEQGTVTAAGELLPAEEPPPAAL